VYGAGRTGIKGWEWVTGGGDCWACAGAAPCGSVGYRRSLARSLECGIPVRCYPWWGIQGNWFTVLILSHFLHTPLAAIVYNFFLAIVARLLAEVTVFEVYPGV
jgi:hypothetical protein